MKGTTMRQTRPTPLALWRQQLRQDDADQRRRLMRALLAFALDDLPHFTRSDWRRREQLIEQLHTRAWLDPTLGVQPPSDRIDRWPTVTRARVQAVQTELRQALDQLFPTPPPARSAVRRWFAPIPPQRVGLVGRGNRVWPVRVARWPATIWVTVVGLLTLFGPAIRRCPVCAAHRWFVREKRQTYCSRACSQRVRSARWYRHHRALALERRHAAYRRATLQDRPGKVKIARRRRRP
jgi:hypothetical protein